MPTDLEHANWRRLLTEYTLPLRFDPSTGETREVLPEHPTALDRYVFAYRSHPGREADRIWSAEQLSGLRDGRPVPKIDNYNDGSI